MTASLHHAWTRFGIPRHAQPWLIYLIVLAFQPAYEPGPVLPAWLQVAALIVVFLPIYAWTTRNLERRPYLWRRGPGAVLGIAGLVVLGLVGSVANSGATVFLVYAAALCGRLQPRRRAVTMVLVAAGAVVVAGLVSPIPADFRLIAFGPVAVLTPILGMASLGEAERARANARLKVAQEEIERLAAVAERERIARDLHDLLGHTLSTITLKAELAGRLTPRDPDAAQREIGDVERISRDALAQVRSAVRGYRSEGLAGELANAKLALDAAGVDLHSQFDDGPVRPEVEAVLALALREAVTNVVRHAGAQRCRVTLGIDRTWLVLGVDDDGTGPPSALAGGSGLSAMRERVRALGGRVTVEASRIASGRGTRVEVALPIERARPTEVDA